MESTPQLRPETYLWTPSAPHDSVWQRPALSGECSWLARPKEVRELFICSSLTLKSPILRRTFDARVKDAWTNLRFHVPELGIRTACKTDGQMLMQYHVPTAREADQWVTRTHACEGVTHKQDFQILRSSIVARKQGNESENAFLLSCAIQDGGVELVKHSQIMIFVDHQIADGVGARILLGKFLSLFACSLASTPIVAKLDVEVEADSNTTINWEESCRNLSQPWICGMNSDQLLSGAEYDVTVARNRDILLNQIKHNPGLPLLPLPHQPSPMTQKTHFMTLTTTQTTSLLQAVKQVIHPTATITHLGHACMVLALLRALPASPFIPETKKLYSPCWLNGRRYLDDPKAASEYVVTCQSFAPIIFEDLEMIRDRLRTEGAGAGIREVVVTASLMAWTEYEVLRKRKSVMGEMVELSEEFGRGMAKKSNSPSSNLPGSIDERKNDEPPRTADPFFLSDGITEQYISHSYPTPIASPSQSSTSPTAEPNPVLTVEDVKFAANAEKNLIVRMSSWRGQTTISGEWRDCDYEEGFVVNFLQDVVQLMLSIIS